MKTLMMKLMVTQGIIQIVVLINIENGSGLCPLATARAGNDGNALLEFLTGR